MVRRVEQVVGLVNDVGDLAFVQAGQLLGQPLESRAGDDVLGFGDVGRQRRAFTAFGMKMAGRVDAQAGQVGAGVVDAADQLCQQAGQVPDQGDLERDP